MKLSCVMLEKKTAGCDGEVELLLKPSYSYTVAKVRQTNSYNNCKCHNKFNRSFLSITAQNTIL